MEILENIKMALASLQGNKLRSCLTMLGIAIGNGSVVALIGVGQGTQKLAAEQFEQLGPNVLFVSVSRPIRRALSNSRPLLLEDAEAIKRDVPSVEEVAPEIHADQLLTHQQVSISGPVIGVTPEYLRVRNRHISQGRFLTEVDLRRNNQVVVLGSQLAKQLFPHQNPLGEQIRIRDLSFQVVGILESKGSLFGSNQDDQALIPLTTMNQKLAGFRSPYGISLTLISVLAKDKERVRAAQFQIENLIQLRHKVRREGYVTVVSQESVLQTATKTNEELTKLLAAIASISLLVGGIGVMNIMLVSVTERTQEIGLRKAVGAQEKDIMIQFLIEAVILATVGGIVGIVISIGGMFIAATVSSVATSVSPGAIILAITVSGTIGLIFGVVPAKQAAKLEPIVALRSS